MRQAIVVAALGLILAGCRTYHPKVRYIDEEYAPYAQDGQASLTGKAFLKLAGGEIKSGADQTVFLVPVTSRSTQAFERGIVRNRPVEPDEEPMSETVKKAKRTVQADAEGNFRFEKLPAGNYYVYCQITYKTSVATSDRSGSHPDRTEVAYSRVTLSASDEKSVTVTR